MRYTLASPHHLERPGPTTLESGGVGGYHTNRVGAVGQRNASVAEPVRGRVVGEGLGLSVHVEVYVALSELSLGVRDGDADERRASLYPRARGGARSGDLRG